MEDNFWNPSVGTPQEGINQYDQALDSSFQEPDIQSGLSAPAEPVNTPQPQQQDDGMWAPQGMDMQQQQQMQLPDIPEAGKPGIDYDMGHLEKIGKSLMVGFGDMFDSMGDMADFIGGTPSNEIQKQMFGLETSKPISDAFHNFGEYLQSYGDDVPGLTDLEDISWDSLTDIEFWETGVARMLPFALSIMATAGGSAYVAGSAATATRLAGTAAKVAAGARSIGVSSKIATTLNATKALQAGIGWTAAGATSNLMEGTALAGQTMNEAIAQGVDPKIAQNAGRQVMVDNLASLGADIIQWGLFAGQLKMGNAIAKTAQKAAAKVAKTTGTTAKAAAAAKQIKQMTMHAPVKNAAKALGMGAANGITDGVIEQFQEVYQDWSVQRRIAEAKGEEFVPYMEFFMADEQKPTRVLSFATSLLMSGASNTLNTAAENRNILNSAMNKKAESHEMLDIFNTKLDEGTYNFKDKDGNLVELNAEKASIAGKDTAARTMIMNAVTHGNSDAIMEWFGVQAEQGNITQEQHELYKETLTEVQESVKNYPAQNLNTNEKALLVANAWLNNVTAKRLEKQRGDFEQRAQGIQSLVDEGKQKQTWADKEIAGLEKAAEKALEQELLILEASSKQIDEVYKQADARVEQERFAKEEGKQLVDIAEREIAGEELTEEEGFLVASNQGFYNKSKAVLKQAEATNKAVNKVGKKEFKKYGKPKAQKDGSVEFIKENKDGSLDAIIVSPTGEVTVETNKDDASLKAAEQTNKDKLKAEFDKFVDTGKVDKATIERIAYKIKNNRGLTKEEMAMREGVAEEVEALLKSKVETKKETTETTEKTSKEYDEYGYKKSQELIELESQLEGKTGQERVDIQDKINQIIRSAGGADFGLPSFQFIKNGKAGKSIRFTIADLKLFSKYVDSVIKEGIEKGWSAAKVMGRVEMFFAIHGSELESLKGLDLDKLGDPQFAFLINQTMGLKYYIEAQLGLIEEYGNNRQPFEVWRKPRVKSEAKGKKLKYNSTIEEVDVNSLEFTELDKEGKIESGKEKDVEAYTEKFKKGEKAPAILVGRGKDGKLYVIDGHRRVLAAKKAGVTTLKAVVRDSVTPEHKTMLVEEVNLLAAEREKSKGTPVKTLTEEQVQELTDEEAEQYFKDKDASLREAVEKGGIEEIVIEGYDYKDPATQFAFKTLMGTPVKETSKRGKNIDPRINYGFTTAALNQAIRNLKVGKKTKALTRHLDFLIEAYNNGEVPIIEGTGGGRITYGVPLNEWMAADTDLQNAVDAAQVLSDGGQYSVKFLKALSSAKSAAVVAKQAAKDLTKKTFSKENVGKVIDFLERAYIKRKIKRAFILGDGSENAVIDMMSEKAADGLVSVNGIINLAKQGPQFVGYAAGMSVFITTDGDGKDEAFFHENFHIFRTLYGHLPEVQEMMNHIVNQPIYNKTKLDYQENILYSVPTNRKGEVIILTQEKALKLIKSRTGKIMATTIEDYIQLNSIEEVTADTYKAFYEESLEILTKNNYLELGAKEQTNIQDEALTKLAGVYGAYNQDMFISDEGKREAYNESMKSWKEKISKAFTKEESDWSLEQASNNQYKKTSDFDFEEKFSQVNELIAKHEAEYGNLATESPSTVKIKALKEEKILSQIEKEMSNAESTITKDAKAFYKTIEKDVLTKRELEMATDEEIVANRKAMLKASKEFRKAKERFKSELLLNYTEGTQEYRDIRNVLRDNNKLIESYIKQAFTSAMSIENSMELQLFSQEELSKMDDNALVALIKGEHQDIAAKFYMHVRQFIESEKYIGNRSDDVKSNLTKANIMYLLKTFQETYPSEMEFTMEAQKMIDISRANPTSPSQKQINRIILGDFFNYLQTEVDSAGNNIFSNVMLQFRSMTTDKGLMWDGKRFSPSISTQLRRKIRTAKTEAYDAYTEEQGISGLVEDEETGEIVGGKKESMAFINAAQNKIYKEGVNFPNDTEFEVWNNLKQRLNYSRRLVELVYGQDEIQEIDLKNFINTYLLSNDNQLTDNQFLTLSIKSENGDYLPVGKYFSKDKLEEMLWESMSIRITEANKENITLEEFQDRARIDVFTPIFKEYNIKKGNTQLTTALQLERNTLKFDGDEVIRLQEVYYEKLKALYNQEKFNVEEYKPYTKKGSHVWFEDGDTIKGDKESIYAGYFNKGMTDEENPNSNIKRFFIRDHNNDVQEIEIKKVKEEYEVKQVKIYKFAQKGSMDMYKRGEHASTKLNDMQGVSFPISALLNAKIPVEDKSYLYTIRSPKGNQLNKNIRKYYLKYGKDALLDYQKINPLGFLSLFTHGTTNPYALKMANSSYELDYHSLDGDMVANLDRDEITNKEVSVMDITEIENAISVGALTYMQPVRDFSDKTRRYYSEAFTILTEEDAQAKLKELVEYHETKTQQVIDRHNDPSDSFDMHLVTSSDVIAELRAEGKKIKKTKNEGHTKKGQLNLLGKRAFELEIDGVKYDLSTYEGIEASTDELFRGLEMMSPSDVGLIGANYFINKFYLQDLSSSILEDQNYTMKNKRSTGYIANHDSSNAGERTELFIFEDAELNQTELKEKVKVLAYEKDDQGVTKVVIKEIDISENPAIMDSASVVTQEEADRIIAKHGDIVDVKGSFKLVGYGNNIDNKKISGLFGQETNTFYAKGHTIVVNETTKGPFEAVYASLKIREQYYKDNNITASIIAYADSGIKKGSIKGKKGTPQNKLSLQEWGELVKKGPDAVNNFINGYSYDDVNDLYGYDGRFFGIQGELDKEAETATSSKQMVSGINVFKGHPDAGVRAKAKKVLGRVRIALDVQYKEEVGGLSREEVLQKNAESDSVPTPIQTMLEDGKTSMPYMRGQLVKLLGRKVINGAYKLRTGGTLSLQESDILYGYAEKAKEIVQTDERLLPMQVVEEKGKFKVNPAEAIISKHLADKLGITQADIDGGKVVTFLATRIPSSSAGSTVALKVKGIATKPGNTIAVSPLVSAIIGSDLDGDMLHINTINTNEDLSKLDEARNSLVESLIDLYLTPEVQSSLTKEIEFGSLMDAHNMEMFGSKDGDRDIPNDLSMLGTHRMYGQTKGNAPMIALIASQNLLYNYISEGNPNLFYSSAPIRVQLNTEKYSNLKNTIEQDGGGTWYTVTKWLNLILDDGKNNVRSKYLFFKNTGNTFVMLLKMGVPSEKISSFVKRAGWDTDEFVYWKQPDNKGKLEKELKDLLVKEGGKESDSLEKLIAEKYIKTNGYIDFDLESNERVDHLAMYIAFDSINDDTFNIGHHLSLDKSFEADPLLALEKHQAGITALESQTQPEDSVFKGIGNNLGKDNQLYTRNRRVNYEIISRFFNEDPYYTKGYREGLIGTHSELKLLGSDGILNTEESTNKEKEKISVSMLRDQEKGLLSEDSDANVRVATAMNLMRMAVHSDIDVIAGLKGIYENEAYGLSTQYDKKVWESFTTEEKFAETTKAVAAFLKKKRSTDKKTNEFIDKLDAVRESEFIIKDGNPKRINIVRFKPNMNKIINEIDFTDQVRIIQKHFKGLPADIQDFFVAYDFVTTGWGSNGNSMSPFFSANKSNQINSIAEKAQGENASTFKEDLRSYIKKNKIYKPSKQASPELAMTINARRIAALSYLALYGNDNSIDSGKEGMFRVDTKNIGLTESNTVTTIEDYQNRIDRVKKSHKSIGKDWNADNEMTTALIQFYSGVPEGAMINLLGLVTHKEQAATSNSDIYVQETTPTQQSGKVEKALTGMHWYDYEGNTFSKKDFDIQVAKFQKENPGFEKFEYKQKDTPAGDMFNVYFYSPLEAQAILNKHDISIDIETFLKKSQDETFTGKNKKAIDELYSTKPTQQSGEAINIYAGTGENVELSNFAERPFVDKEWGIEFKTVEGAFQAQKLFYITNPSLMSDSGLTRKGDDLLDKLQEVDGAEARRLGGPKVIDGLHEASWDVSSAHIMKGLIKESFKQNPDKLQKLLATGNATLTHTQDKGKWGKLFPKILMEVREELRPTQQSPDTKHLKVPLYEFDGTSYEGIGQEMDYDKYISRKLPTGVKIEQLADIDKRQLEHDFEVYKASVKKVKSLYNEIKKAQIEDAKYSKDMSQEEADAKFKRNRDLFKEYNDILSHEDIGIESLSQGDLFEGEGKVVEDKIDEIAANPLRRFLEYHFGNQIAEKQIFDWQKKHGKDLGDISDEMRAKDISALNMVLSPGDFGKSKPAIAYINKNMKMTHMKYTRSINLVTKEMNEKLENLYRANYDTEFAAGAAKLWLKYMPMGTTSITDKLFGKLVQVETGLKKVIEGDKVTYRDVSDVRIKPELVYKNGDIKKGKGSPWHDLNKAEQEYLEMYVKYTNFYRDLIENKELYGQNRGGTYIPSITSSRWETLHKRGLFGVYYQMFKGDQDLADILVTDVNPLTGDTETLDYFSWKSLYMYGSGEKIRIKTDKTKRPVRSNPKKTKSGIQRIEGLQRIKKKAQGYLDNKTDINGNTIERKSTINQLMALESEEAMNRFNHKRSMTSSYLATQNMHGALRSYISLFMFQHGNAFRDGDTYKLLSWNKKTREFDVAEEPIEDMKKEELAFTGFDDKKQEVDAAIANLGGGKVFDASAKYGDVKNTNAINYLQKVVKRGLINKERGFTFSDFESEAHVTNFFVNWTMYVALGLNVPAAVGNVLIGKFNSYRQMGGDNAIKGEARYWGLGQDGLYDDSSRIKARKMIEEFGILTYRAEEIAEGVGGSSLSSLIFWPMITAENWIQQAAFLGALTDEQWNSYYVDKKGDLQKRKGAKGITQEEMIVLERDVINVQGRGYSETDVRMIQMYALSNMTMQFKRWFPTFLRDRFGKEDIDDIGTMRMGAYTAAADFMSKLRDENKMWNITEWNKELKKLPKHKQDAVMRYWRGTHGVTLVAMLLGMSAMYMDDDEKDSEAVKLMEKLLGDMLLVVNAPKLTYMANIPALNTFKNLNLSILHAAKGTEYSRRSKYGDKGDKKFVSNLAQLLPKPARQALQHKKAKKRSLR